MELPVLSVELICTILLAILLFVFLYVLFTERFVENVREKFVLITGCDSGLGKLLAQSLDQDGVHVFATCMTEQGETALQETCSSKLRTLRLDVTQPEQIQRALAFVERNLPRNEGLWGLVNNAGIHLHFPFDWTTAEDMKSVFDVNVFGTANVTKAMLPLLKKGKGRIVNVSSGAGRFAIPFFSVYSMSKHSVEAFSDCLRIEMKPFKVSVHIIEPGATKTKMTDSEVAVSVIERRWSQIRESTKKEYGETFLINLLELAATMTERCKPPEPVVRAMRHALLSTHPKHRYRPGWSPFSYLILCLPTWLTDSLLSKMFQPEESA